MFIPPVIWYILKPPLKFHEATIPDGLITPNICQVWHHSTVLGDGSAFGGQRRRRRYALLHHRADAGTNIARVMGYEWLWDNDLPGFTYEFWFLLFLKKGFREFLANMSLLWHWNIIDVGCELEG